MPTAIRIHDADILDHMPAADLPVGAVVVLADRIGITQRPIPAGYLGALALSGVYEVDGIGGEAGALGAPVFWNAGTQRAAITAPATGDTAWVRMGILAKAIATTDTRVRVLING